MVNEVNKIIYNTLIAERAVTLPSVGTLSLVRHTAAMASKDVVTSPKLSIEFSSHTVAVSVVDVIADVSGVDAAIAEDIYMRWLEKVHSGSTLNIEGVGVLRNKSFEMDNDLAALLNGATSTHVAISRRHNGRVALWLGLVLSIITLIISVFVLFKNDVIALLKSGIDNVETSVVVTIEEVVKESVADDNIATGNEDAVVAEAVTEEIEEIELVAPKDDNWTMHDNIRHWVVAGSYSTMENAERAIIAIEEEFSDIHCKIFTLGKMFAVAIYGSSDLEECSKYKQEHCKEFEQCWIFTPKEYR